MGEESRKTDRETETEVEEGRKLHQIRYSQYPAETNRRGSWTSQLKESGQQPEVTPSDGALATPSRLNWRI